MSAMNRYTLISLIALLFFVVALPHYAMQEQARMKRAQETYRQQAVAGGAKLYIKHCRLCHGDVGEGVGAMPALDNPALIEVDPVLLSRTISRAAHGSEMAAWHIDEGGMLNDYQINELVNFIRFADWELAAQIAQEAGPQELVPTAYELGDAYLEVEPHDCVACHEDPTIHRGTFGLSCERCHTTVAWTPAYLTRHTFFLDHGGQGKVDCQTCHIENYYTHTCYECHDHQPQQMEEFHLAENIIEYQVCADCHPTGQPGEAERMLDEDLIGSAVISAEHSLANGIIPAFQVSDGRR